MKQSHRLVCIAKNCDWSKKITPLSNLTRASLPVERKLIAAARAELNCEICRSKKMLEKSCQFLSLKKPYEPKSFDSALNIEGVENYTFGNLRLRSTVEAI